MRWELLIIALLAALLLVSGCAPVKENTGKVQYNVTSLTSYNNSLCSSTGYENAPAGFNSGLRIVLKDKVSGDVLIGSGTIAGKSSSGSIAADSYSCEDGISSDDVIVSAYAQGYAPTVFSFKYPKGQLASLDVFMAKSCTDGQSYFDSLELTAKTMYNQSDAESYINESKSQLYDSIKNALGLDKADYSLQCIEANMGRGGYIKAKGTFKDGSPFALYYHWGWCSSGGSDCGSETCLSSSSDAVIKGAENNACKSITSVQYNDSSCSSLVSDNTAQVRESCNAGYFENNSSTKSFSIVQASSRCNSNVSKGEPDCLAK